MHEIQLNLVSSAAEKDIFDFIETKYSKNSFWLSTDKSYLYKMFK